MHKILIVDDEQNLREGLRKALKVSGYNVKTAPNGKKGLDLSIKWNPDIIVTDIIMPEQDGIGFILEAQKNSNAKIIAMSGGGKISAEDHLNIAKKLGACETLTKPFEFFELIEIIKGVIQNE